MPPRDKSMKGRYNHSPGQRTHRVCTADLFFPTNSARNDVLKCWLTDSKCGCDTRTARYSHRRYRARYTLSMIMIAIQAVGQHGCLCYLQGNPGRPSSISSHQVRSALSFVVSHPTGFRRCSNHIVHLPWTCSQTTASNAAMSTTLGNGTELQFSPPT